MVKKAVLPIQHQQAFGHEPVDRLLAASSGSGASVIVPMPGQPVVPGDPPPPVRWWDALRSEALSSSLQIGYFKLTKGKRLFKMAPLHLHFELLGWSETQVVQRFWLIGLLAAMVGVGLAIV